MENKRLKEAKNYRDTVINFLDLFIVLILFEMRLRGLNSISTAKIITQNIIRRLMDTHNTSLIPLLWQGEGTNLTGLKVTSDWLARICLLELNFSSS
jgi:hypothetical protein